MKYAVPVMAVSLSLFAAAMAAEPRVNPPVPQQAQVSKNVPDNPAIDIQGYLAIANEAAKHRESRRVTEEDFVRMSLEKGTIVLDARSKEMYDLLHVKGAINLSFPNIAIESIQKAIPDKETRILIYCNNNFKPGPNNPLAFLAFATKMPTASLNISTYIALYNYGYKNVYELGPLVDPDASKLTLVSSGK